MRRATPKPRNCERSGKRVYETEEQALASGMRVMLGRRRDVFVYPCASGGFHISTVENRRCR